MTDAVIKNLKTRVGILERNGVPRASGAGGVSSVNSKTGVVTLTAADVGAVTQADLLASIGWSAHSSVWTRTDDHTFTTSDPDGLAPGTKVSYNDGAVDYGIVGSVAGTTVNLIPNTSYLMAATTITAPRYSYSNPPDFPSQFLYAPTITGYTTIPPNGLYTWSVDGNGWLVPDLREPSSGTKNGTAASPTYSLPWPAKTISFGFWDGPAIIQNNTIQPNASSLQVTAGGLVITVASTYASANAWTPSVAARVAHGSVRYPFF